MIAWVQHLVDDGYFKRVEMFYLFAGHTHSPIDQNFSVIHNAINRSSFVASTIAMHELFKVAHDIENEKSKLSRITEVIQLQTYHDYVKFYEPVVNPLVHNYQGPHRFLIEYLERWGQSDVRCMWQSPSIKWENQWLPIRPIPAHDSMEVTTGIELTPFAIFGGHDEMLASLQIDTSENVGALLATSTCVASSNNVGNIGRVLPSIRQVEYGALAELTVRYDTEATSGRLAAGQRVKASKSLAAEVEKEMLSQNNKKAGHLLFLKRSLCKDPNWLDTRPEVLPNPKRWLEVCTGASAGGTVTADAMVVLDMSEDLENFTSVKTKKKTKDSADHDKAATRLLRFNSGAATMAKVANFMLDLAQTEVRLHKTDSEDIVAATRCFKKAVLTKRDQIFYKNISSVANIKKAQEILVAQAEAEPWRLLRLPDLPQVRLRRESLKKQQEILYKAKADNINRLLGKVNDGFDVTREIITRDGKETIFKKTIQDMTLEQLRIVAGAAKITGRSKFKTKPQYIEAINKYLAEHPTESLSSLCGEEVGAPEEDIIVDKVSQENSGSRNKVSEVDAAPQSSAHDSVDPACPSHSSVLCPVKECVDIGDSPCELCHLTFCSFLHGSHNSHICQSLKNGYAFPDGEWAARNPEVEFEVIRVTEKDPHTSESSNSAAQSEAIGSSVADDHVVLPSNITTTIHVVSLGTSDQSAGPSLAETVSTEKSSVILETNATSNQKRKHSSIVHKGSNAEETREVFVANQVRRLLESNRPDKAEAIHTILNFEAYDLQFLQQLSHEFNIDISNLVSEKRPKRARVLDAFIELIIPS